MFENADRGREVGGLALRLAMVLAMLGAGVGPARATDPADGTERAGADEAAAASAPAVDDKAVDAQAQLNLIPADLRPPDTARRRSVSPLDRRVMLLARELGLDASQQARVKKALEDQREQVARVWNDSRIPAARRVAATQAIGDRTADRIRAVLSDEQRKKYIKPRQRDVAVGTAGGNAEAWMNASRRR